MRISEIFDIDNELLTFEKLQHNKVVEDLQQVYSFIESYSNNFSDPASYLFDADERSSLYSQSNMLADLAKEYLGENSQSYNLAKRLCEYLST